MHSRQHEGSDATRTRIMDVAERLVQTRGFNGFSYADIATEVGITKASLHYHFATKAELGAQLVARYSSGFGAALQRISAAHAGAPQRLRVYVKLYADVLAEERMCLCGMVAAEYATLPAPMQQSIRSFFELNEGWVAEQIELGVHAGAFSVRGAARDAARMLVGALEGEMLVARAWGDPARFASAAALLLAQLNGQERAARRPRRPRAPPARARTRSHGARS